MCDSFGIPEVLPVAHVVQDCMCDGRGVPIRPLVLGKKAGAFRLECVDRAENRKGNASKQIKRPQSYRKVIGFAAAGRDSFLEPGNGKRTS